MNAATDETGGLRRRIRAGLAACSLVALLEATLFGCSPVQTPAIVPSAATTTATATAAARDTPAAMSAQPTAVPSWSGTHPNILLVIADDFGVDASPCYKVGAEKPVMPTLERLCSEGVVFDNVWVSPMCSPTRATILTGQYGFRTGVLKAGDRLRPTESIQDLLTAGAEYSNALIGKWHLEEDPAEFGIQHYAAFLNHQFALPNYSSFEITEDGVKRRISEYATTAFTDLAIDWVAQQRQPWFLWLAYNAPHDPYHLPPLSLHSHEDLPGDGDIHDHPRDYYFAAAEAMDTEMGRLLDSLDPQVRDETVVIFVGDNGTPGDVAQAPFTSGRVKDTVYQGGISAPLVIAGAGVSRRGEREDTLVNGTDLFATIAQLGGNPASSLHDSVSFADALVDSDFVGRTHTYAEFRNPDVNLWAVRDVRYKLIGLSYAPEELYDLLADPFESTDLAEPIVPNELQSVVQELEDYHTQLRDSPG